MDELDYNYLAELVLKTQRGIVRLLQNFIPPHIRNNTVLPTVMQRMLILHRIFFRMYTFWY